MCSAAAAQLCGRAGGPARSPISGPRAPTRRDAHAYGRQMRRTARISTARPRERRLSCLAARACRDVAESASLWSGSVRRRPTAGSVVLHLCAVFDYTGREVARVGVFGHGPDDSPILTSTTRAWNWGGGCRRGWGPADGGPELHDAGARSSAPVVASQRRTKWPTSSVSRCIGTKDTACVDVCPVELHPHRARTTGVRESELSTFTPMSASLRRLRAGCPGAIFVLVKCREGKGFIATQRSTPEVAGPGPRSEDAPWS